MTFLTGLGPWTWFIVGAVLLMAEIVAPGASLVWLGIAALITGAIAYGVALSWQAEVVIFAVLAIVAVLVGRRIAPAPGKGSDRPFLNRRAEGFVGRVFVLEEPIQAGVGRVRINDSVWRVEGPDTPAGTSVKVVAADGATLRVEPV